MDEHILRAIHQTNVVLAESIVDRYPLHGIWFSCVRLR
jgi:hypothetical protein